MNLTRSAQQRMVGRLEIHVNRLSSPGDDPKDCHTLAAVHLIFNSIPVSFLGPFTSVVEIHMNWSSWAGCPTHCQEETVTHMLVISETTAELSRHQVTTLTFQELTGQILAFKASALAQHACPQRVRHFCEKYADDAEFWSVWVRAGLLSSRLIFVWGRIFLFFCCHQLTASQSRATAGTWLLG